MPKDISTPVATTLNENDTVKDYFVVRDGIRYAGTHLIIDLYGASRLNELPHIEETLRACITASKATLLHMHLHPFEPNGVSGVAVLAESHISVHTWPESDYAAFDVFMCGATKPEVCADILEAAFKPKNLVVTELLRGKNL
ncbi:adenosylmethionine decarboxylase [Kordiimonas pumila]|uniref:Adenosylmethionine decarboxylase n=1 Tax=Kordiimonas pumila TaxID=2161677 RepID=A0ABV7D6H6_9PROT|nr:adenosylmethionine decarboxylase [Kordiimonas pumila]